MKDNSLIGKWMPVLDKGWIELQDVMGDDNAIVAAARTSFLGDSKGPERDKKLLFYLMQHGHTTPFEMVEFKFRVRAPVITWWQWVRHRTFCLTGDTEITFNRPDRWRQGKHTRQTGNRGARFTLERLYHLWREPLHRRRIEKMLIRVYDEKQKLFTVSHVTDVIHSGKKEVFEIDLEDGKQLKCSKDHLLLTSDGWQRLEDAVGLSVSNSGRATMSKACQVITNGSEDPWRSYDWMAAQRAAGCSVQEIAEAAGCSYHNIRKWLRIHGLQFDQRDYQFGGEGFVPWNKGKTGYAQPPRTEAHLEKLRANQRRGATSNFWRGGISSDRALIAVWTTQQAPRVHAKYDYVCQFCGQRGGTLHAHHVQSVVEHPELAYDFDNLISVCQECHTKLHRGREMSRSRKGRRLVGVPQRIVGIRLVAVTDTYDISVEGPHHNFVANGVVVHNSFNAQSGRYTPFEENDFYVVESDAWRLQSSDNKQASEGLLADGRWLTDALMRHYDEGFRLYEQALAAGVAREQARLFLAGFGVYYTWVGKVDAHNLMRFLKLRMAPEAQHEIRVYAQAIYDHFFKPALPWTAEAFEEFQLNRSDP